MRFLLGPVLHFIQAIGRLQSLIQVKKRKGIPNGVLPLLAAVRTDQEVRLAVIEYLIPGLLILAWIATGH